MKCCRCNYEQKSWPIHGWTVTWTQGRFWFCPECLGQLLTWWLDLTHSFGEADPSRERKKK